MGATAPACPGSWLGSAHVFVVVAPLVLVELVEEESVEEVAARVRLARQLAQRSVAILQGMGAQAQAAVKQFST